LGLFVVVAAVGDPVGAVVLVPMLLARLEVLVLVLLASAF
jgi:hypothetical protein